MNANMVVGESPAQLKTEYFSQIEHGLNGSPRPPRHEGLRTAHPKRLTLGWLRAAVRFRRVLFIDDDPHLIGYVQGFLPTEGFDVEVAESGQAGLALARSNWPELIVLDKKLPDLDGIEVLRQLVADGITTPVVVLTAWPDDESRAEAMRLGAIAYLEKPLAGQRLVAALEEAMVFARSKLTDAGRAGPPDVALGWAGIEYPIGVRDLVTLLDRLGRRAETRDPAAMPSPHQPLDSVRVVLRVLLDPNVGVPVFMLGARVFRAVCQARHGALKAGVCHKLRQRIGRVARPLEALNPKVAETVARLQATGKDVLHVYEADVAHEYGVNATHLGRLVKRQTGIGFREWRWGIAMRSAVRGLTDTDDQVKYIAAESGFATNTGSTAGFERSFGRLFGMAPSEFRNFVRNLASASE